MVLSTSTMCITGQKKIHVAASVTQEKLLRWLSGLASASPVLFLSTSARTRGTVGDRPYSMILNEKSFLFSLEKGRCCISRMVIYPIPLFSQSSIKFWMSKCHSSGLAEEGTSSGCQVTWPYCVWLLVVVLFAFTSVFTCWYEIQDIGWVGTQNYFRIARNTNWHISSSLPWFSQTLPIVYQQWRRPIWEVNVITDTCITLFLLCRI